MAKVTITFTDNADGSVDMDLDTLEGDSETTAAELVGAAALAYARDAAPGFRQLVEASKLWEPSGD